MDVELRSFLRSKDLIDVVNQRAEDYTFFQEEVEAFQWLVHMIPIKDDDGHTNYKNIKLRFPSDFVSLQVAQQLRRLKFDWKTLGHSMLLGQAYESHTLNSLFEVSGKLYLPVSAMKLGSNNGYVDIPAVKEHVVYSSNDEIKEPKEGALYIPGLDFVMPPWIFQVTIKKMHSAKQLEKVF